MWLLAINYDVPIMNAGLSAMVLPIASAMRSSTRLSSCPGIRAWKVRKLEAVAARMAMARRAHSDGDCEATRAVLSGMIKAGVIPEDLDAALRSAAAGQLKKTGGSVPPLCGPRGRGDHPAPSASTSTAPRRSRART